MIDVIKLFIEAVPQIIPQLIFTLISAVAVILSVEYLFKPIIKNKRLFFWVQFGLSFVLIFLFCIPKLIKWLEWPLWGAFTFLFSHGGYDQVIKRLKKEDKEDG
jgi:hypothetical protein